MVQLYEDQILRGKDMNARAELARKVARMWEEQLTDAREAADAWRRVLRMKTGDAEATAGLERAKQNMLKKPDPDASDAYAPPKLAASGSIPAATVPAKSDGEGASEHRSARSTPEDETPGSKPSTTLETSSPKKVGRIHEAETLDEPPETQSNPEGAPTGSMDVPPKVAPSAPGSRPDRPRDLWFRSSQDDATMSALSKEGSQVAPLTPSDGVYTSAPTDPTSGHMRAAAAEPNTATGEEDLGSTNENAVFDDEMLESTAARPQEDHEVAGVATAAVPHPRESVEDVTDDELLIADELDDLIDASETQAEEHTHADGDTTDQAEKPKSVRSIPPPLPRG
jgi:hypothetical protein